jgi:hypothetical protein
MRKTDQTGTVFIKEGTTLPESLRIESEPYSKGWRLITQLGGCDFDRTVSEAGWTLFFMAGEVNATVLGSDSQGSADRAVRKLMMKMNGFNCLEIAQVASGRALGLPSVTASGHARHIQKSMFLVELRDKGVGPPAETAGA